MFLSTPTLDPISTTVFPDATLSQVTSLPNFYDAISLLGGDSQLQRWSSLIGIITAIIGNILISFALNIQRYAHIRLHEERMARKEKTKKIPKSSGGYGTTGTNGHVTEVDEQNGGEEDNLLSSSFDSDSTGCSHEDHSSYLQSPYWWGGILLMTVGEAGNFLAYGFAPASIVSPLGVVALISNCVIAPIMLKEQFRYRDFWGVVVAVGGAVTVVLSAKTEEKKLGPHEIWGAITTTAFEIYLGLTIGLISVLIWASPKYGNKTILIDLGLVGLFGESPASTFRQLLTISRWLYSPVHQRCCIDALFNPLESLDNPSDICSLGSSYFYGRNASEVRQQSTSAVRLNTSHPCTICNVHFVGNYWECDSLPGFRKSYE